MVQPCLRGAHNHWAPQAPALPQGLWERSSCNPSKEVFLGVQGRQSSPMSHQGLGHLEELEVREGKQVSQDIGLPLHSLLTEHPPREGPEGQAQSCSSEAPSRAGRWTGNR